MAAPADAPSAPTYEELIALEQDFDDVDLEILRQQSRLSQPLYTKRAALVSQIPHFWPLVLEQSPPELDTFIQPSDSALFADCLTSISVERFELDTSPRSIALRFEFAPNDYFEDAVLEKKFWYRRSKGVKIRWKKGKDLTKGLTDAAVALWEARQKAADKTAVNGKEAANGKGKGKKAGQLPEYTALARKLEANDPSGASFFCFFGFVGAKRWISAEENAEGKAEEGEKVEEEEVDEEEDQADVEIFAGGDEVANVIAEDLWPNAIKYFTSAQEMDDENMSDMESEDASGNESDEEVDIRGLVGKGKKSAESSPPAKKRRT
ncbi:hypothetical protein H2199_006182 [Coniosporium tulheliwenetii]|uniref:Uncharacterized protein n=1 Tax=Coniosporium tulheliwenetii TaxID=3383036 RepID=A0ACC2YX48_9PEZI|nr:hypothetical protein H2199_006182 [Cladosporium sp. JES 115]